MGFAGMNPSLRFRDEKVCKNDDLLFIFSDIFFEGFKMGKRQKGNHHCIVSSLMRVSRCEESNSQYGGKQCATYKAQSFLCDGFTYRMLLKIECFGHIATMIHNTLIKTLLSNTKKMIAIIIHNHRSIVPDK